ncbi:MAG: ASCH domain-containing protein [Saprospiraceae bacterium]
MISTETQKNASSKPELYTVLTTGRVLHLTLKKKWFMMIAKGVKTEEYREIKDYWIKRLKDMSLKEPFHAFKDFDKIVFKNGYSKDAPTMIVEFKGIKIDKGFNEWGAEKGRLYFVIKLGKVLFNSTLM